MATAKPTTFQLLSGPKDKAETLTWNDLHAATPVRWPTCSGI